jgi:hypothetical protein
MHLGCDQADDHSGARKVGVTARRSTTIEVSSIGHVAPYVHLDFGFGFSFGFGVAISDGGKSPKKSHTIHPPSETLPPLNLVVWHGETLNPSAARLLDLIRHYAQQLLRFA